MNSKPKKTYYFTTFLVYYFFILLAPLLIIIATYAVSYHNSKQSAIENQVANLYQKAGLCDTYMKSAEELAYQLSIDYTIREFMNKEAPGSGNTVVADIYHMKKLLFPYIMTNFYMEDIYLDFSRSQTVISAKTSYFNLRTLWEIEYKKLFPEYEEWADCFWRSGENGFMTLSEPGRYGKTELLYRKNIETSSSNQPSGILLFLNLDNIQDLLWGEDITEDTFMTLLFNGECLMADGQYGYEQMQEIMKDHPEGRGSFSTRIGKEKVIVAYCHSSRMEGTYVSIIKQKVIDGSLRELKIIVIGVLFLTFFLVIGSIILFAYKTALPWDSLVRTMEKGGFDINEQVPFSNINQQIQGILQKNKHLASQVESLRSEMIDTLWRQLMTGQYDKEADLMRGFQESGVDIRANIYVIIIITVNEVDSDGEKIMYRMAVNDIIRKHVKNLVDFYEINMQTEATLLKSDDENYVVALEKIEKELSAVQSMILKKYEVNISFSGSMCYQLGDVHRCLEEAKTAMGYEAKRNDLLVSWFSRGIGNGVEHYSYTLNTEQELIAEIIKGNPERVKNLLVKIHQDNFIKNICSEKALMKLNGALLTTVYRVLDNNEELEAQLGNTLSHLEITDQIHMEELFDEICRAIYTMTEYYKHGKYTNEGLYYKVLFFINNNYMDNQISLTMVAGMFEITEIYLSKFFKQKSGQNFSKYIEELRMKKAAELLKDNTLSVQTVSEMTGYNSAQVFRRAYKKYYGKTPRE